jgi:tetratricopeptide (TPR) repeat protein
MDPMGLGDNHHFTTGRGSRRWTAALLTLAAAAGCGDRPAEPANDASPLPRYWQGMVTEPRPEAWAVVPPGVSAGASTGSVGALLSPREIAADDPKPVDDPTVDVAGEPISPTVVTPSPMAIDGAPTGAIVNDRAAAKIRRGYELAERGAYFAARSEFIAALRMIAEAKDQLYGAPRRTIALADGLRALDEAKDFSAFASDAPAKLSMTVIVSSHRTPAAKDLTVDELLPQQLAEAYFRYAQEQLGAAVAGEPAGSMALHALGKLASRMGRIEPAKNPQADRRALTLQNAALMARNDNHLAAHELGVLLAESGHYGESEQLLRQVAAHAPDPVVFRNLARVERRLGRADLATRDEQQAAFLVARGAGGDPNIAWVPAEALARTPDAMGPMATPARMAAAPGGPAGSPQSAPMTARAPGMYQR